MMGWDEDEVGDGEEDDRDDRDKGWGGMVMLGWHGDGDGVGDNEDSGDWGDRDRVGVGWR